MKQKYFFIFLFSFEFSNTQSSVKDHFKTFFSRPSSTIGIGLLSITAAAIVAKKFYAKKNSHKNNPSFKNNSSALPDTHVHNGSLKPLEKPRITAIELTSLQQEHENEQNILRKMSALKQSWLPFTEKSDDDITQIIASYHRVITENKKIREHCSVNEIKTLNTEIEEKEKNIQLLEKMRHEKALLEELQSFLKKCREKQELLKNELKKDREEKSKNNPFNARLAFQIILPVVVEYIIRTTTFNKKNASILNNNFYLFFSDIYNIPLEFEFNNKKYSRDTLSKNILTPFSQFFDKAGIITDFNDTSSLIQEYNTCQVEKVLIVLLNETCHKEHIQKEISLFEQSNIKNAQIFFLTDSRSILHDDNFERIRDTDKIQRPFIKKSNSPDRDHEFMNAVGIDWKQIRKYKETTFFKKIKTPEADFYIQQTWNPLYFTKYGYNLAQPRYYYYPFGIAEFRKGFYTFEEIPPILYLENSDLENPSLIKENEKIIVLNQANQLNNHVNIVAHIFNETNKDYLNRLLHELKTILSEKHDKTEPARVTIVPMFTGIPYYGNSPERQEEYLRACDLKYDN